MADTEGFEEFYTATVGRLLGVLFPVTGDLHEAEEIVQEAYARASTRWARLRDHDAPEAWVRRVAMNLAADRGRRLQELADAATREGVTPGPAHAIRRGRRRRRRVTAGIASLVAVALAAGAAGVADRTPDRHPRSASVGCAGPRLIARGTAYGRHWVLAPGPHGPAARGCAGPPERPAPRAGRRSGPAARPPRRAGRSWPAGARAMPTARCTATSPSARPPCACCSGDGRQPLQVPVVKAGAAFRVDFYIAFYPQPGPSEGWAVDQLVALDPSGRTVARCRERPPPGTCVED